jgi:hypothetical protein
MPDTIIHGVREGGKKRCK